MKNKLSAAPKQKVIKTPDPLHTKMNIQLKKEYRCDDCDKLLGIDNFVLPSFEIKCVRCGKINGIFKDLDRQIIITDKFGTIMYINKQVELATGYTAKEILGNKPSLWGKQMSETFYKKLWDKILKQKKAVAVQLTNKHKNNTQYEVVLRISPILNAEGDVEYFLGIETIIRDPKDVVKIDT